MSTEGKEFVVPAHLRLEVCLGQRQSDLISAMNLSENGWSVEGGGHGRKEAMQTGIVAPRASLVAL